MADIFDAIHAGTGRPEAPAPEPDIFDAIHTAAQPAPARPASAVGQVNEMLARQDAPILTAPGPMPPEQRQRLQAAWDQLVETQRLTRPAFRVAEDVAVEQAIEGLRPNDITVSPGVLREHKGTVADQFERGLRNLSNPATETLPEFAGAAVRLPLTGLKALGGAAAGAVRDVAGVPGNNIERGAARLPQGKGGVVTEGVAGAVGMLPDLGLALGGQAMGIPVPATFAALSALDTLEQGGSRMDALKSATVAGVIPRAFKAGELGASGLQMELVRRGVLSANSRLLQKIGEGLGGAAGGTAFQMAADLPKNPDGSVAWDRVGESAISNIALMALKGREWLPGEPSRTQRIMDYNRTAVRNVPGMVVENVPVDREPAPPPPAPQLPPAVRPIEPGAEPAPRPQPPRPPAPAAAEPDAVGQILGGGISHFEPPPPPDPLAVKIKPYDGSKATAGYTFLDWLEEHAPRGIRPEQAGVMGDYKDAAESIIAGAPKGMKGRLQRMLGPLVDPNRAAGAEPIDNVASWAGGGLATAGQDEGGQGAGWKQITTPDDVLETLRRELTSAKSAKKAAKTEGDIFDAMGEQRATFERLALGRKHLEGVPVLDLVDATEGDPSAFVELAGKPARVTAVDRERGTVTISGEHIGTQTLDINSQVYPDDARIRTEAKPSSQISTGAVPATKPGAAESTPSPAVEPSAAAPVPLPVDEPTAEDVRRGMLGVRIAAAAGGDKSAKAWLADKWPVEFPVEVRKRMDELSRKPAPTTPGTLETVADDGEFRTEIVKPSAQDDQALVDRVEFLENELQNAARKSLVDLLGDLQIGQLRYGVSLPEYAKLLEAAYEKLKQQPDVAGDLPSVEPTDADVAATILKQDEDLKTGRLEVREDKPTAPAPAGPATPSTPAPAPVGPRDVKNSGASPESIAEDQRTEDRDQKPARFKAERMEGGWAVRDLEQGGKMVQFYSTETVPDAEARARATADERNGVQKPEPAANVVAKEKTATITPLGFERHVELARLVADALQRGEKLDNAGLLKMAEQAFGGTRGQGTFTPRDAYDAMEAGLNRYIEQSGIVDFSDPAGTLKRLLEVTDRLARQDDRTKGQVELQQFSTPPGEAFLAVHALGDIRGLLALEPSAGNGSIATMLRIAGAKVACNEIDPRRAALLRWQGFDVTGVDAELLNSLLPPEIRPDVVAMNPPFSSKVGVKAHKTEFGARHVAEALARVKAGGRVVAIVGTGMAHERPNFGKWWDGIEKKYTVRANVGVSGKFYGKFGTGFDNQILVLDKTGPTPGKDRAERLTSIVRGSNLTPEQVLERLAPIKDRTYATDKRPTQPTGGPPAGDLFSGSRPAVSPAPVPADRVPAVAGRPAGAAAGDVAAGLQSLPGMDGPGGLQPGGAAGGSAGVPESVERPLFAHLKKPAGAQAVGGAAGGGRAEPVAQRVSPGSDQRVGKAVSEQYRAYVPTVLYEGAQPHPAKLVESSGMADVSHPPITYSLRLPAEDILEGRISDAQAEAVTLIGQRNETKLPDGTRAGMLIAAGTGVGKARIVAAGIKDAMLRGEKRFVWVLSSTTQLKNVKDALRALGLSDVPLLMQREFTNKDLPDQDGILVTQYSQIRQDYKTKGGPKIEQIKKWLGDNKGSFWMDEAGNLKNAVGSDQGGATPDEGTAQGMAALALTRGFKDAQVVYVSATPATEPRHFGYMVERLGLVGDGAPWPDLPAFISAMEGGGLGMVETLLRDLKQVGAYWGPSLSYEGVEYDRLRHELSPDETRTYNDMADLWAELQEAFDEANEQTHAPKGNKFSAFYSAQQGFFLQLMTALQLPTAFRRAEAALADGRSVVFTLFNTREGDTARKVKAAIAAGEDLEGLDLGPNGMLIELIKRQFPVEMFTEVTDPVTGQTTSVPVLDDKGEPVLNPDLVAERQKWIDKVTKLRLPDNPLDAIGKKWGWNNVAEISGRGKRMDGGKWVPRKVKGVADDEVNRMEVKKFQDGKVRLAVVTAAGSEGLDLHSSLDVKNQQRRELIALQLLWSADKQQQTFGRVHRSNEANQPFINLVHTNVASQQRLVNQVAKNLAALGAASQGERGAFASKGMFEHGDLTDVYGQTALLQVYNELMSGSKKLLQRMGVLNKDGNVKQSAAPDVNNFLNRLMVLRVADQNRVFERFARLRDNAVEMARANGTLDTGVEQLPGRDMRVTGSEEIFKHATGATTSLRDIEGEVKSPRMTFEQGLSKANYNRLPDKKAPAFYQNTKSGKVYAVEHLEYSTGDGERQMFRLTGASGNSHSMKPWEVQTELSNGTLLDLSRKEAEKLWREQYDATPEWVTKKTTLLTGLTTPVWEKIFPQGKQEFDPPVVATELTDGTRVLGMEIPKGKVSAVKQRFGIGAELANSSAADVFAMVMDGAEVELDNGWKLRRSKVRGERRLELDPGYADAGRELKRLGLFSEVLSFRERWFVPTDETEGPKVLEKLLAAHKAIKDATAPPSPPAGAGASMAKPTDQFGEPGAGLSLARGAGADYTLPHGNEALSPADREVATAAGRYLATVHGTEAARFTPLSGVFGQRAVSPILRAQSRAADSIQRFLGVRVLVFETTGKASPVNGFVLDSDPGIIFLSADAKAGVLAIMGHEFTESLRRQSPELYQRLENLLTPLLHGVEDYRKEWEAFELSKGRRIRIGEPEARAELIADVVGNAFCDPEFWRSLQRRSHAAADVSSNTLVALAQMSAAGLVGRYGVDGYVSRDAWKIIRTAVVDALTGLAETPAADRQGGQKGGGAGASVSRPSDQFEDGGEPVPDDVAAALRAADISAEETRPTVGAAVGREDAAAGRFVSQALIEEIERGGTLPTPMERAFGDWRKREGDTRWQQVARGLRTIGNIIRKSATDTLEMAGGRIKSELLPRVNGYFDDHEALNGVFSARLFYAIKPVPVLKRPQLRRDIELYWLVRECRKEPSPATERKLQEAGVADRSPEQLLEAMPAATRAVLQVVESIFAQTVRYSRQMGVKVKDARTGQWRASRMEPEGYVPRVMREDIAAVLREPNRNPAESERLMSELVEHIRATRFRPEGAPAGNPAADAQAFAQQLLAHYKDPNTRFDFFGNLEMGRIGGLPPSWFEYGFDKLAPSYIAAWAKRMAQIKNFGQATDKNHPDFWETLLGEGQPDAISEPNARTYVLKLKNALEGKQERDILDRALGERLRAWATVSKLSNPFTAIRNSVQVINAGTVFQWKHTLPQMFSPEKIRNNIKLAREAGVLRSDLVAGFFEVGEFTEKQKQLIGIGLKLGGFTATEQWQRAVAIGAAYSWTRDALAEMRANPRSHNALRARGLLLSLGVNPDALEMEGLGGMEGLKLARAASRGTMFAYDPRQLPLWADTPKARFFMQFQKYGIQEMRFVGRHVIDPALHGYVVDGQRVRDFRPLMFILAAMAGGAGLLWLREAAFKRANPDASLREIVGAAEAGKMETAVKEGLMKLFHTLTYAGAFGILGDWSENVLAFSNRLRGKNPLQPPGLSAILNLFDYAIKAIQQGGRLTLRDLHDWFNAEFPGYAYTEAFAINVGGKIAQMGGDSWKAAELQQARMDESKIRRLAIRYADEAGFDRPLPRPGGPNYSPNSPEYRALHEALLTGDVEAAREVRDRMEGKAGFGGDEWRRAVQQLRGAVAVAEPARLGGLIAPDNREFNTDFRPWLMQREPGMVSALDKLQKTYRDTAHAVGLMGDPREIELNRRNAIITEGLGKRGLMEGAVKSAAMTTGGLSADQATEAMNKAKLNRVYGKGPAVLEEWKDRALRGELDGAGIGLLVQSQAGRIKLAQKMSDTSLTDVERRQQVGEMGRHALVEHLNALRSAQPMTMQEILQAAGKN
ncbi:MAG: strawberry notch family protein [Verrucomicrobia bacterium]|nr:strawberry notch family protein [Verrucomicrobiota bacterium]